MWVRVGGIDRCNRVVVELVFDACVDQCVCVRRAEADGEADGRADGKESGGVVDEREKHCLEMRSPWRCG